MSAKGETGWMQAANKAFGLLEVKLCLSVAINFKYLQISTVSHSLNTF